MRTLLALGPVSSLSVGVVAAVKGVLFSNTIDCAKLAAGTHSDNCP